MSDPTPQFPRAGFFRRLAAMFYDVLVAVAIGMCAALLFIVVLTILMENGVLSKLGYQHVSEVIQHSLLYKSLIQLWVLIWVTVFFMWFWKNGGQTLGMRAWRLRILSRDDKPITYGRVLLRMLASVGGLGTLLVLFDYKNKLSLQDRIANTEIVSLSKEANHHRSWKGLN